MDAAAKLFLPHALRPVNQWSNPSRPLKIIYLHRAHKHLLTVGGAFAITRLHGRQEIRSCHGSCKPRHAVRPQQPKYGKERTEAALIASGRKTPRAFGGS